MIRCLPLVYQHVLPSGKTCALLALYAISCLFSTQAYTLPDDAEQPLYLEAESLEYDEQKGTITYSGDVLMRQGSMSIQADEVIIFGKIDRATRVIANGKPAHFQQTPEINAVPVTAEASRLEYAVSDKSLWLQGNASLNQEGTSLSGNTIQYDVKNALVKAGSTVVGSNEKRRVKMIIPPKALETDK